MAQKLAVLKEKAFKKELNNLDELLIREAPDPAEVERQIRVVRTKYSALEQAQQKLLEELLKSDKDDEYLKLEDDMSKSQKDLDQAEQNAGAIYQVVENSTASVVVADTRIHLPKLKLQDFNGDIRHWLTFWAGFQEIHDNSTISNAEKFQYLLQCIPATSTARRCIEGFPVSGKNYQFAVDALKNTYGKESTLVKVYMRDLLHLAMKNANDKDRQDLTELVPLLVSQIRNLEELGATSDKCEMVLYPVVESCLPDDTLQAWQRSSGYSETLDAIIKFLNMEVQNTLERNLARMNFSSSSAGAKNSKRGSNISQDISTASALMVTNGDANNANKKTQDKCVFCRNFHLSRKCRKAQGMSLHERREIAKKNKLCFNCLTSGHHSSKCDINVSCNQCNGNHCSLMCSSKSQHQPEVTRMMMAPNCRSSGPQQAVHHEQLQQHGQNQERQYQIAQRSASSVQQQYTGIIPAQDGNQVPVRPAVGFSNVTDSEKVALNTFLVAIESPKGLIQCRVFVDSGSQLSYVEQSIAAFADCEAIGQKVMRHQVFEGRITEPRNHPQFLIKLRSLQSSAWGVFVFNALPRIAQSIEKPPAGKWIQELENRGIFIQDQSNCSEKVQLLIGMDVLAQIKTGGFHRIDPFFIAEETIFGWIVGGIHSSVSVPTTTTVQMVTTMMLGSMSEEQLWSLETLGITDEPATQSRQDLEDAAMAHFQETVTRLPDGRYQCRLPWIGGHQQLLSNRTQATARLHLLNKTLKQQNLWKAYDSIFKSWIEDGIVEVAPIHEENKFQYFLPHRHVVKESSTTPVRPVFDASSKVRNSPSLNDCLERGPNLLERIPAVVSRFRLKKYAIVSDIRKAFLQISVYEEDRVVLQFLWWKDESCKEIQVLRHKRVVFGVSSSPFLLAATLQHHLRTEGYQLDSEVAEMLLQSFYVDNSCSSHDSMEEAMDFKEKSTQLLSSAQMDLRGWEFGPSHIEEIIPVLGMLWNTNSDMLSLSLEGTLEKINGAMTKRGLLSAMNAVFDPMGFASPFTIVPKLLFQKCCLLELKWDDKLPEEIATSFGKWKDQVPALAQVKIPRWTGAEDAVDVSFHIFSDASYAAFSCAVFQRTVSASGAVCVRLMVCKSRVAPSKKKVTIPRLELLGCLIGVRLMQDVKKYLNQHHTRTFYWTDSSTALAWICHDRQWARFVQNRVDEIKKFSKTEDWRHVAGIINPADLPSRGCTATTLVQLQWWEGPEWLKTREEDWPVSSVKAKEEDVLAEARKTVVSCQALKLDHVLDGLLKFSNFHTSLRIVSLVLRFLGRLKERALLRNTRVKMEPLVKSQLQPATAAEIQRAEHCIVRYIQSTSFTGAEDDKFKRLATFMDEEGIIRIKSQLFYGDDHFEVRCPAILPSRHPLVKAIIQSEHRCNSHAGVQTTLAILRNRFWILKGRRTVSAEIGACLQCRRFVARKCQVPGTPLPKDRITSSAAFGITGVDLLGPLFLYGGEKVWVVLFTCAVYRCVHLEVTKTLSTEGFMQAFRRFVARRGRPTKIYSDNGLNFVGCNNLFANLDWEEIRRYAAVQRMEWSFNPPTAAWWGGFWERLVGLAKDLLRRILGKRVVSMEELRTIVCDVEATLNERPLTYLSDVDPLVPLTPAMFLREIEGNGFPEADAADTKTLRRSVKRCQSLREQLRSRFRKEYLGQLQHFASSRDVTVKPGDFVLIQQDDKKRLDWAVGVVKSVIQGRDGRVRTARIKTKDGEFLRPLQRLYIMEAAVEREAAVEPALPAPSLTAEKIVEQVPEKAEQFSPPSQPITRSGRRTIKPDRLRY